MYFFIYPVSDCGRLELCVLKRTTGVCSADSDVQMCTICTFAKEQRTERMKRKCG